jgi:hypothetical protein
MQLHIQQPMPPLLSDEEYLSDKADQLCAAHAHRPQFGYMY